LEEYCLTFLQKKKNKDDNSIWQIARDALRVCFKPLNTIFYNSVPNYLVKQAGFLIPTGRTEPAGSGSAGNRKKQDKFEFQTKSLVQAVGTGIPTGLTDILDRFPVV
jgi:hypothetical protein